MVKNKKKTKDMLYLFALGNGVCGWFILLGAGILAFLYGNGRVILNFNGYNEMILELFIIPIVIVIGIITYIIKAKEILEESK